MKHLSGAKFKNIQVQISKAELEKQQVLKEKSLLQSKLDKLKHRISSYQTELNNLKHVEPVVSEHAILRYLQRVYNLDLEKLKDEILPAELKLKIKEYGSGTYNIDQVGVKVVDNVVVTVIENKNQQYQSIKQVLYKYNT